MTTKTKYFILLTLSILMFSQTSFAQKDKVTLQKKYDNILKDIQGIESMIDETEARKKKSLNQLGSLSAKIDSRKTLIENINDQIVVIEENLIEKKAITKSMQKDIDELKKDYAKMVFHSYKNLNTTSFISFLLSSETFNQAIRRINYLKSYVKYRKEQAARIKETIIGIQAKVEMLEEEKAEKESLLLEEEHQRKVLLTEKTQKDNLITKLKDDSNSLRTQIKTKNSSAVALNNQIQKIIKEEILLAEAKAKEQAEKNTTESKEYLIKESKLSKDFVNNMGKLPWPVDQGHIIGKFGVQPHPTLKKVTISNNGVDIRTKVGESAKVIFDGVVVNSFYLPTTQNSLIIKHGEYFTVYSNLESISVNLGDKIKTGQSIGKPYTSKEENVTKVHLEIWKSTTKLDPEKWIVKK